MEGFLEAIFSNFFLILIILSGIIGFFRNNANNAREEQKEKQLNRPKPASTPPSHKKRPENPSRTGNRPDPATTVSMEKQQQEQMERLADQLKTTTRDTIKNISEQYNTSEETILQPKNNLTKEQAQLKKEINTSLNQKGLIQGIIMSEVLGAPRGRKPYRSVIEERKIK
ncbi:hypothetical protein [Oceanobacillus salinisoli]|uniref:hypothetical protein n=1 Tax=Oceanobacillus salinisoli TaxID=2678611 RepID=UPI0012E22639|nr:hypothetical protein [Oceanobacillus salinisoli]